MDIGDRLEDLFCEWREEYSEGVEPHYESEEDKWCEWNEEQRDRFNEVVRNEL